MIFENSNHIFFIGVAGTGMSALAQYCYGIGKKVSGSDRYFDQDIIGETHQMLMYYGIECFAQDASGINSSIDLIVISTAVEETNNEIQKARSLNIPIIKRSELLNAINATKKDHGASWRMVISLTAKTEAYGVYPGGQSGNPGSKYYDNFIDQWAAGKYYSLWMMTKEEVGDKRVIAKMSFAH